MGLTMKPAMVTSLLFFSVQIFEFVKQEHVYLNKQVNENGNTVQQFETKSGLSVDACIEECKLRRRCRFVNYNINAKVCYMLMTNPETITLNITNRNGFIYARKTDWNMTFYDERCASCSDTQLCQLPDYPSCITTGCDIPPAIEETNVLGNRYVIGSLSKYECQYPKRMMEGSQSQISCLENGLWTESQIQCTGPCKDNWTWDNANSCYYLETNTQYWNSAKTNCEQLDSHLVIIGSTEEADFLNTFLAGEGIYIGLSDQDVEGSFRWVDGTNPDDMYSNWGYGEPNNLNQATEDCVKLQNKIWYDITCLRNMLTVCEYEI